MKIAIIGHKRIPSNEGGIEKGVEQHAVRMVQRGNDVTVSTYGTIENRILNQMQKLQPDGGAFTARTKRKYLLSRIFPGREWCKAYAPTVYKYPVLLPFFWVWRLIYKGITNRKKVTQEIKTIKAGKQN